MKDWAKWLLFFSSYLPLYGIIAVQTRTVGYDFVLFETPIYSLYSYQISLVALLSLGFGAFTFIFLYFVIKMKRGENGQPKSVQRPQERNELVLSYILVHVVPFAFIDYTSLLNFLAFAFLFLSLGIIQVRSSHLYVNPILSFLSYDMYEIDEGEHSGKMLLLKVDERPDSDDATLAAVELSNNVYITTK